MTLADVPRPLRRRGGALALGAATALATAFAGASGSAAQEPQPPSFGREIELVRVDVVVTGKDGQPVKGLTRDQFTLLDEGKPQPIETFEAIDLPLPPADAVPLARPRVATNAPPPPGTDTSRTVVIVFDDLNLTNESAPRAKAAVAAYLDTGLREGDRVTLVATGGGVWWSTRMLAGRADLLAILKNLTGRRVRTDARDAITDYEAMRIFVMNDSAVEARVRRRFETYGVKSRAESEQERQNREVYQPGVQDPYVSRRAQEEYMKARARNRVTLATLERAILSLGPSRERKTVLLASDGFVYDIQEDGFRRVVEAARRANAAISFLDARGLMAPGFYSAQFDALPGDPGALGAVLADTTLDAEGSEALAIDTGGYAIRSTNDLTDGAKRIAQESRSYYLLGFTPQGPRDGKFRKLAVKVRAPGTSVRSRRGYYASSADGGAAQAEAKPADRRDAVLQSALDTAEYRPAIPLRMTALVLGNGGPGKVQALVATEIDASKVSYEEKDGELRGTLDFLLVVAQRETGEFSRYDQKIELLRNPAQTASGSSWYTVAREFELNPGGHQARVVVRDARTQEVGSLAFDFEVPPVEQFRIGTPVLTDRLQQQPGGGPGPVVVARRTFKAGQPLYCRFDVYGAATGPDRLPAVTASHVLRAKDGTVLGRSEPTPISPTSLGAVARLMAIPLNVEPGEYELVLTVRDTLADRTLEAVEPFTAE
jgi:VWFA-related protein